MFFLHTEIQSLLYFNEKKKKTLTGTNQQPILLLLCSIKERKL